MGAHDQQSSLKVVLRTVRRVKEQTPRRPASTAHCLLVPGGGVDLVPGKSEQYPLTPQSNSKSLANVNWVGFIFFLIDIIVIILVKAQKVHIRTYLGHI